MIIGTHLSMFGAKQGGIEKNEIGNIPPNLVNLVEAWEKRICANVAQQLISLRADTDNNLISILRRDMHTLELPNNVSITSDGIPLLPPGLTVLNLDRNLDVVNDENAGLLPRSITKLHISHSRMLSKDGVAKLPPQLIVLEWNHCQTFDSSGAELLPRSLTSLSVSENPNINSSMFKLLPRSLSKLEASAMKKVENKDLAFLPRSLLHLDLNRVTNIDREGVLNLPTELKYLNIQSAQLKLNDFVLLSRIETLIVLRNV